MAYDWHVMSTKSVCGIQEEVGKRSAEGWELTEAYGMKGTFGEEHVLIFRRQKP